jgi:hypothetical protein
VAKQPWTTLNTRIRPRKSVTPSPTRKPDDRNPCLERPTLMPSNDQSSSARDLWKVPDRFYPITRLNYQIYTEKCLALS